MPDGASRQRLERQCLDRLRQACVRLQDPARPECWGTGFFVATDRLLTCWHVLQMVVSPEADAAPVVWQALGTATLLEQGGGWDLALLRFTAEGPPADQPAPVVLALCEDDPLDGASLRTVAYPVDAAGRHDATYRSPVLDAAPSATRRWTTCGSRPMGWCRASPVRP